MGILAALAIPRLTGTRNTANRSAVLANLRTIESAIALAEANGDDISVETEDADDYGLIEAGHLAKWPEGPGTTTYQVISTTVDTNTVYRAQVTLPEAKAFGFTAPETETATLDDLVEP